MTSSKSGGGAFRFGAACVLAVACIPGLLESFASGAEHEPAKIPFDINRLSAAQMSAIRDATEADPTIYDVRSRPIFFQIVETGSDADETRQSGEAEIAVDVLIYGLGEERDGRLVDYGWIEHVESGRRIWEMALDNVEHAGGDPRNRRAFSMIKLQPGTYRLRYVSDDGHAFGDWRGEPPERPRFYGITVFNLTAFPRLEARLMRQKLPPLSASLVRERTPRAPTRPGDEGIKARPE